MKRTHLIAVVTTLLLSLLSTSAGTGVTVDVAVSLDVPATDFVHRWTRSWGSGHAALTLRDDWRAHLVKARDELGLQGVRYHGLFDDDMGPVVVLDGAGHPTYNFTATCRKPVRRFLICLTSIKVWLPLIFIAFLAWQPCKLSLFKPVQYYLVV